MLVLEIDFYKLIPLQLDIYECKVIRWGMYILMKYLVDRLSSGKYYKLK